jgi:hypothetical protein
MLLDEDDVVDGHHDSEHGERAGNHLGGEREPEESVHLRSSESRRLLKKSREAQSCGFGVPLASENRR